MIRKTYKVEFDPLDTQSIDKLIKYIDEQWVKKLESFAERVTKRLTDEGKQVVYGVLSQHMDTGDTFSSLTVRHDGEGVYTIYGNSVALFFLEFGSGVRGKASGGNEWGDELGYIPGSFGKNGLNPGGWMFPTGEFDKNGHEIWKRTKGHPAYKPFYTAFKTMDEHLEQIINEEFDPDDFA